MTRTAIIVDAYSTGRFLASEMARYDVKCVHVQSGPNLSEFFISGFQPDDFTARHIFSNPQETTAALRAYAPFCTIAGSETGVEVADLLADTLGTPANIPALSTARRNKNEMARALEGAGVRAIRGITASDAQTAIAWMRRENLREVVVKPVNSAATEDVFFCKTPDMLEHAAKTILGKWNLTGSYNDAFLVQERIIGQQHTVNAVVTEGEVYISEIWTYEIQEVPGAGSICSHEWLLDGNDVMAVRLADYLSTVALTLGVLHGPIHAEIIVDDAGPVAVDVAARMQGFMSPIARQKALGHTHITLTTQGYCDPAGLRAYAAGNTPYQRKNHALCVSLISDTTGEVRGQPGLDAIKALPSFADAIGFLTPGKQLTPTRDLVSTPGIVYLVSPDRHQIEADYACLRAMPMDQIFALP